MQFLPTNVPFDFQLCQWFQGVEQHKIQFLEFVLINSNFLHLPMSPLALHKHEKNWKKKQWISVFTQQFLNLHCFLMWPWMLLISTIHAFCCSECWSMKLNKQQNQNEQNSFIRTNIHNHLLSEPKAQLTFISRKNETKHFYRVVHKFSRKK